MDAKIIRSTKEPINMAHIISKDERRELEEALAAAIPYTEEEICVLDGEEDLSRIRATIAKKLLEMVDEKKG